MSYPLLHLLFCNIARLTRQYGRASLKARLSAHHRGRGLYFLHLHPPVEQHEEVELQEQVCKDLVSSIRAKRGSDEN